MRMKSGLSFILLAVILQCFFWNFTGYDLYQFPFLAGVPYTDQTVTHNLFLAIWFFPVFFMISYFSGTLKDLISGYGILLLIRNYNKTVLLMKQIIKLHKMVLLFILLQLIVYAFPIKDCKGINIEQFILELVLYYIAFVNILMLQLLLEMYLSSQLSNMLCNLFIVVSVFLANYLWVFRLRPFEVILFPNILMGYRNVIKFYDGIVIKLVCMLVLHLALIIASVYKFHKKDFI